MGKIFPRSRIFFIFVSAQLIRQGYPEHLGSQPENTSQRQRREASKEPDDRRRLCRDEWPQHIRHKHEEKSGEDQIKQDRFGRS